MSIRRKTSKKKVSVFEKLHKIMNYYHYTIFDLADDDISSESESELDSEEEEEEEQSSSHSDSDFEIITSDDDLSSSSE